MSTPTPERRGASRAATLRRAILSLLSGRGGMVQGTTLDVSADGLRLSVPVEHAVGTEVEVYLPARPDRPNDEALTVTGRVLWSAPQEDGSYMLGLRLYEDAPPTSEITSRAGAEALIDRVREELLARAAAGPQCVVEVSTTREAPTRRKRRWPWLLLALLALLLVGYGLERTLRFARSRGSDVALPPQDPEARRAITLKQRKTLDDAQQAVLEGRPQGALDDLQRLTREGNTPATRLIAALGYADALRAQGRAREALAAVKKALQNTEGAPKAWRDLAAKYSEDLARTGANAAAPPLLVNAVELLRPGYLDAADTPAQQAAGTPPPDAAPAAPQAGQATPPAPAAKPVAQAPTADAPRIEVDQSDYVLTLFRGDQPVAQYAVGLGSQGATPTGDFVIANKLLDPDWFNHGESVPAGDPRNPLGRHWMGLGDKAGPTSYGIHETSNPASIGANLSRGCIRMRASDATELFAACPIGTPVKIVD